MKTFTYSAREPGGAVRRGTLQAQDRAAAVAALRGQGVVPLTLEEGPAGMGTAVGGRVGPQRTRLIALAAGALVAVVAGGMLLLRGAPRPQPEKPSAVAPIAVPVQAVALPRDSGAPPAAETVAAAPVQSAGATEAAGSAAVAGAADPASAAAQAVVSPAPTNPPPRRRPGVRITDKDGNEMFKPRPEIKTQTDRFLWAVVNSSGTGMIPVAVPHVKRDFTNALNARIEIRPDDTPEDIAAKQGVEQLKQEIKTLLDEGHALEDVIQVIQRERNTLAEYRRGVQQTLFQLVREGRMEEAATYQEAANQELSKENAAPLYVPDKLLEIGEQKAAAKQADP